MKVNVLNLEKKLKNSVEALDAITSHTIYVGIRDPEQAMKAFRNEFGCWNEKAQRMNPARPFLAKTFRGERQRRIKGIINRQINKVAAMGWKEKGAMKALQDIANQAAEQVKWTIVEGRFTPNAEATVKKKHHSQVLIGKTGDMYDSIEGWVE